MSKSNLNVSLGCMTFGREGTKGAPLPATVTDLDDVGRYFDCLVKHGHHEVDTANGYTEGTSEEYVGHFRESKNLQVATKLWPPHTEDRMRSAMKQSLEACKTQQLDIWYWHALDTDADLESNLKIVDEFHKAGHFKRFGTSNCSPRQLEEIVRITKKKGWVQPTVHQTMYNVLLRKAEEIFPTLRKHGIAFYCFNPIGGGLLTGKVQKDVTPATSSRFDKGNMGGQIYQGVYYRDEIWEGLEIIRKACEKHQIKMVEVALRWMNHHSAMKKEHKDTIILGASKLHQLEETLSCCEQPPLPEDLVKSLDEAWAVSSKAGVAYHMPE